MNRPGGPRCDPKKVFELADGALLPEDGREVLEHLDRCHSCKELYREELELSACMGGLEVRETPSVCREVAMALPTRLMGVRMLWAGLALGLLLTVSLVLSLEGYLN